jgi:hypothetical protein
MGAQAHDCPQITESQVSVHKIRKSVQTIRGKTLDPIGHIPWPAGVLTLVATPVHFDLTGVFAISRKLTK